MKWLGRTVLFLGLLLPSAAVAAEAPPWEFGLRGGMDATGVRESYAAGEVYLLRTLPWRADIGGGTLRTRLDLGVGYLDASAEQGGWLAGGANLVYALGGGRVEFEAGFRPAWVTRHNFGRDDLGGDMQFASHGGIAVRLDPIVLSYRFQHLSNASIYEENDGLDLHLFGVGARF